MTGTSRWYWVKSGKTAGPITWGELQQMARSGRLRADDPVLREGSETWQPAKDARDVEEPVVSPAITTPTTASASARPSMQTAPHADQDLDEGSISAQPQPAVNAGRLLGGMLLCGGGIVGTVLGYNAAVAQGGGRYIVFTGPIIWGLVLIGRSFGRESDTSRQY